MNVTKEPIESRPSEIELLADYLKRNIEQGTGNKMGITSVKQVADGPREPAGESDEVELHSVDARAPVLQQKPTALVVDDSIDIAIMLVMILQHSGYEAVMSTSAVEALKLTEAQHFDLVVSDIAMPGMDGYALAMALRSRPEYQGVPLVAVTGFDQYDDRQRALAAGFNTHIRKPIDPTKFIDLIQKLRS